MTDISSHFPPAITQKIVAADGRTLCFADWGGDGYPVLFLHGIPGCRLAVRMPSLVAGLGGRLITYDRPGCGQSDRLAGRTIADCAPDVRALADALRLDEFAVVGVSAGSPHAFAVSAILGDRVSRVASYGSIAPRAELGADEWSRGQDEETREYLAMVQATDDEAVRYFTEMDDADRAAVSPDDPALAYVFEQHLLGVWGTIDDERAHMKPWGFDVAAVQAPTMIWYDAKDTVTPIQHAQWLARVIPDATLVPTDAMGHGSTGDPTNDRAAMYTWLTRGGELTH